MTSHDQLWKDLSRAFFPDLLFVVDPDLAAGLAFGPGAGGITFLDKEVFLDQPEGKRYCLVSGERGRAIFVDQLR